MQRSSARVARRASSRRSPPRSTWTRVRRSCGSAARGRASIHAQSSRPRYHWRHRRPRVACSRSTCAGPGRGSLRSPGARSTARAPSPPAVARFSRPSTRWAHRTGSAPSWPALGHRFRSTDSPRAPRPWRRAAVGTTRAGPPERPRASSEPDRVSRRPGTTTSAARSSLARSLPERARRMVRRGALPRPTCSTPLVEPLTRSAPRSSRISSRARPGRHSMTSSRPGALRRRLAKSWPPRSGSWRSGTHPDGTSSRASSRERSGA